MSPTVVRDDEAHRYELRAGDEVLGFAEFVETKGRRVILPHTEIAEGHEGKGNGFTLARGVLDDMRERHAEVIPTCPFLGAYIVRHPEYDDLVTPSLRPKRPRAAA